MIRYFNMPLNNSGLNALIIYISLSEKPLHPISTKL